MPNTHSEEDVAFQKVAHEAKDWSMFFRLTDGIQKKGGGPHNTQVIESLTRTRSLALRDDNRNSNNSINTSNDNSNNTSNNNSNNNSGNENNSNKLSSKHRLDSNNSLKKKKKISTTSIKGMSR